MRLYAGQAPNAFRVFAFMREKEIEIPLTDVDVMKGETRQPEHLARNSLGEIPVLELDDGSYITESVAICRYLESLYPQPPLFGVTAAEQAKADMWNRRMEQQIMGPCAQIGMHLIPVFADKIEQMPAYAEAQKRLLAEKWQWLDQEMSDGRAFVMGDQLSIGDITGMAALMISGFLDLDVPEGLSHVQRWKENVEARPGWGGTGSVSNLD